MFEGRRATPEMVDAANPPEGYMPILSTSAFGWENGPIFEKLDEHRFWRGFRVAPRHVNAGGSVHGGMIMTFADIVLARGVGVVADPPYVTVRITTDFVGPAFEGDWVLGTATAEHPHDGMAVVVGEIRTTDRVVASIQGIFKILRRT